MAATEYMQVHLKFNNEEINEFEISDTKVSAGSENVLYVVLTDSRGVKDIRNIMAECQYPDLMAVDFIPPQYYERYIAQSRYAKDMRYEDSSVKTQIRFGTNDVELLTKTRGSNERCAVVPMEVIESKNPLPKFDHKIQWKRKEERPPHRKVSPNKVRAVVPSLRLEDKNHSDSGSGPSSKVQSRKTRRTTSPPPSGIDWEVMKSSCEHPTQEEEFK